MSDTVYFNGEWLSKNAAYVPVSARGFRFGDGAFDTIRIEKHKPYLLEWHLARLTEGLQALAIGFDVRALPALITELVAKNGLEQGFVRIYISRGGDSAGYMPLDKEAKPIVFIETLPLREAPSEPVSLWRSTIEKISPKAIPTHAKIAGAGVGSMLALQEARTQGCFEALLLSAQGHVAEASSGNICWLKEGVIYTPSAATGALPGSIMHRLALLSKLPIQQGEYPISVLETAEAVCITNVNWLALPVAELKPLGFTWESRDFAQKITAAIRSDM